jgi:hypothetical protein
MTKDDKKLVERYYKKASKQPEITEMQRINEASFSFKFADEYFTVAFSEDDETMIIAEGLGDPFTNDTAHELGIYEIEELSF